jgi:hypothetical protein
LGDEVSQISDDGSHFSDVSKIAVEEHKLKQINTSSGFNKFGKFHELN